MTVHLPLVALELSRSGRRKSLYLLRAAPAILCLLILLIEIDTAAGNRDSAESLGSLLRNVLLTFQVATALLAAPVLSAAAIARERQENTLGLLLLANCRAHDLVLAKTLAAFIQSELLILSCLPLQGIAAFFGGITIQASLYDLAVLSALNLAMTTSGVMTSALTRRAADAYMIVLTAASAVFVTVAVWIPNLSPFIDDNAKSWQTGGLAILVCLAIAAAAIVVSIAALRRPPESPPVRRLMWLRRPLTDPLKSSWIPRFLRLGPIARLFNATATECGAGLLQGPAALIVLVISVLTAIIPFGFVGLFVVLVVAYDTSTILSSAQRRGDLDLLFVTSASDNVLTRAIFQVQLHRSMVFLPALSINAILMAYMLWREALEAQAALSSWSGIVLFSLLALVILGDALVRLLFIVAVACSTATTSAPASTFLAGLYYLVLALLLGCMGGASIGLMADMASAFLAPGETSILDFLVMAVVSFFTTSFRWLLTLIIAYVVYRSFQTNVECQWRPGRGPGFSSPRD